MVKNYYEKRIWELSCATAETSEDEAHLKIQAMWNKYKEKF